MGTGTGEPVSVYHLVSNDGSGRLRGRTHAVGVTGGGRSSPGRGHGARGHDSHNSGRGNSGSGHSRCGDSGSCLYGRRGLNDCLDSGGLGNRRLNHRRGGSSAGGRVAVNRGGIKATSLGSGAGFIAIELPDVELESTVKATVEEVEPCGVGAVLASSSLDGVSYTTVLVPHMKA